MGWIRERILAEHRKHYRVTGGCDWAKLAEAKIIRTILEDLRNLQYNNEDKFKKIMGSESD